MSRGFFLTFEGLDGSGKTTQLRRLAESLERQGLSVLTTRQPGDTAIGERIRSMLLDSKLEANTGGIAPLAEMALMFADRAQSIREIIAPALEAGKIVLCDRFTDSTEAYQGGGRELGSDVVLELHRVLCGDMQPDLTILLLPDLDASLARARRRNTRQQKSGSDENRFEQENRAFYERVRAKYVAIAARDSVRVIAIEGDLPIETSQQRILESVQQRLQQRGLLQSNL
ncbi:MAG TPA: dTMP kinase [Acidobacteriaceae bacterium]|jgi:dTMP kinase|nr:dTMP kinase [Acidobacteriaceae bacterium]